DLPPLFRTLQQAGQISTQEMREVFNLGVGLVAVLPPDAVTAAQAAATTDRAFRPSVTENTMRAAPLVTGLFLVTIVPSAFAQTAECTSYIGNAERVCAAAVDGT